MVKDVITFEAKDAAEKNNKIFISTSGDGKYRFDRRLFLCWFVGTTKNRKLLMHRREIWRTGRL